MPVSLVRSATALRKPVPAGPGLHGHGLRGLRAPLCAWIGALAALAALAATAGPAAAQQPGAAAGPPGAAARVPLPANEARQWLARMQRAAADGNYVGTLVYSAGGHLSSARVWHFRVGGRSYERLEAMDGRQQQTLRIDDEVQTLWPQSGLAIVERRERFDARGTTPGAVDPLALESYRLLQESLARVAGRDAQVLLLEPRDALRHAQRLWADIATGLMLRADVLAAHEGGAEGARRVVESQAFSEIELGVAPDLQKVMARFDRLDGYRVLRPKSQSTTLEDEGWTLAQPVAGFRLAGCVRRGVRAPGGDESVVLQAVFSDGLTHVSVFVEPYSPDRHRPMQAQRGATASLSTRRGEHWLTVVGDVPPPTLVLFAEALERRR